MWLKVRNISRASAYSSEHSGQSPIDIRQKKIDLNGKKSPSKK